MPPPPDVDGLVDLLQHSAEVTDGEAVDLLAHGLQCAELLAVAAPSDLELQVAGLVHDLGHVVARGDDAGHAGIGTSLVEPLLGPRVASLVRRHADAKRYLVQTDPAYDAGLSERSRESLVAQGGRMSPAELADFAGADLEAVLALRRADDAAKVPGATTASLLAWLPALRAVAGR